MSYGRSPEETLHNSYSWSWIQTRAQPYHTCSFTPRCTATQGGLGVGASATIIFYQDQFCHVIVGIGSALPYLQLHTQVHSHTRRAGGWSISNHHILSRPVLPRQSWHSWHRLSLTIPAASHPGAQPHKEGWGSEHQQPSYSIKTSFATSKLA